jgi:hypothetical protein
MLSDVNKEETFEDVRHVAAITAHFQQQRGKPKCRLTLEENAKCPS